MSLSVKNCNICPRHCNINRNYNNGFCNEQNTIKIAKIIKNFKWEEPCLSDKKGVLAIFFSGCNLRCDYCQNHEISRGQIGKNYSINEFINLIEKEQLDCDAIDLITPTHFSKNLIEAFKKINKKVPVIWNTSSYETTQNIENINNFVDIYLADLKYSNNELGQKFSQCLDYFSYALPAIKKMCELKQDKFDNEIMKQGVIIRHLVLPNYIQNSLNVLDVIKKEFANRKISIMSQFTPNGKSILNRKLNSIEYKTVIRHMEKINLDNGYIQDFESANESFIPKFI